MKKNYNNNVEFNNLVDDLDILKNKYLSLQSEMDKLKNINYNLKKEVKTNKLKLEYNPNACYKLEKIENIIKSTKRETKLFNQISYILIK